MGGLGGMGGMPNFEEMMNNMNAGPLQKNDRPMLVALGCPSLLLCFRDCTSKASCARNEKTKKRERRFSAGSFPVSAALLPRHARGHGSWSCWRRPGSRRCAYVLSDSCNLAICHPTNDLFYVARLGVSATLQLTTSFTWLVLEYLPRSNQRLVLRGSSWSICHGLVLGCIDANFCK